MGKRLLDKKSQCPGHILSRMDLSSRQEKTFVLLKNLAQLLEALNYIHDQLITGYIEPQIDSDRKWTMAEASKPIIILATNSRVSFRWPSLGRKRGGERDSRDLVAESTDRERARKKNVARDGQLGADFFGREQKSAHPGIKRSDPKTGTTSRIRSAATTALTNLWKRHHV